MPIIRSPSSASRTIVAIPRLEDVQRQVDAGEEDGVRQREQGQGGWSHTDRGCQSLAQYQCTVRVFFSR